MKSDIARTADVFLDGSSKPLLVILGPTASGKTGFSIELAKHIHGEIVNADSRQLYRGLDIGTAKITQEEMEGVPHHLIDMLDPKEELTVSWYRERAEKIIEEIRERGNIPLLVGGSMLYLSSITDGLTLGPPKDTSIRTHLEHLWDRDGGVMLYNKLQKVDPESAAGMHPNNKHRVIRALEIYEILKEKKSQAISSLGELRPRTRFDASTTLSTGTRRRVTLSRPDVPFDMPLAPLGATQGDTTGRIEGRMGGATQRDTKYDLLIFSIERSPVELKERIAQRTEEMFARGWIDEVRGLLARGYEADDPGMKSCGYGEIISYLRELENSGSDMDIDAMQGALKKKIIARTRQYAKRQMTWWRGDARIRWITL